MNQVTVLLAPTNLMSEFYFSKDQQQLALDNLASYEAREPFFCDYEGEEAAEEAFDLTNNPSRQDERENLYGRYRSVSVGDIVQVNEERFLCMSCGWEKL